MAHKNVKELKKAILEKAKRGVSSQLPTIQRKMQQSIKEVVYDAYSPIDYERRGFGNGGLGDANNIVGEFTTITDNGFEYKVQNVAMPSHWYEPQVYLAPLIILGQQGAVDSGYPLKYRYGSEFTPYGQSRDFISDTKEKLDGEIVANLERYMKR